MEEEEYVPITVKSDHEFSPESDIEDSDEIKPVRRARTAQKGLYYEKLSMMFLDERAKPALSSYLGIAKMKFFLCETVNT